MSAARLLKNRRQDYRPIIALCLVAYLMVERERFERGMLWRQFKRHLILKKPHTSLPALEWLRTAA